MNFVAAFFSVVFPALMLGAGISVLFLVTVFLRKRPTFGVALLAITALTVWEIPAQPALFSVAGVSVYYPDLVSVVFLATALLNARSRWATTRGTATLLLVFIGLIGFSLSMGAVQTSGPVAVNEARPFIASTAGLVWGLSVRWTIPLRRKFIDAALYLGWALVGVAVYHALRYGTGDSSSIIDVNGLLQTNRVLIAPQALIVGIACVWAFLRWSLDRSRYHLISGVVFALTVLVSQQRSAWAATIVGLAIVLAMGSWSLRRTLLAGFTLATTIVLLASATSGGTTLFDQISSSFSDQASYENRTSSWDQLVAQVFASDVARWFGFPFGSGYTRIEPNGLVQHYQPHNWYVSLLLRTGLIGLTLFVAFLAIHVARLVNKRLTFEVAAALMIATFWWVYGFDWFLAPFLGFALSGRPLAEAFTEESTPASLKSVRVSS